MKTMKKLNMVIKIELPVWTEVQNAKDEFPIIRETILDNLAEMGITDDVANSAAYMISIDEGKAIDANGDACEMEEVSCAKDWKGLKVKVERVKKAKKNEKA